MNRMFSWLSKIIFSYSSLLLAVEASFVIILVYGLAEVIHGLKFSSLLLYSLFALAFVRFLSQNVAQPLMKIVIICLGGVASVLGITANLIGPIFRFGLFFAILPYDSTINELLKRYIAFSSSFQQLSLNFQSFYLNLSFWFERILSGRLIWLEQPTSFFGGLLIYTLVVWLVWSIHSTKKPILAVLPSLVVLGLSVDIFGGFSYYFSALIALSILVITLYTHFYREETWERKGIGYSQELRFDLSVVALFFAMSSFFITIFIPSISLQDMIEKIQDARRPQEQEENSSSGFTPNEENAEEDDDILDIGVLPNSLLITGPPELQETALFQIRVIDDVNFDSSNRFYWRYQTLTEYTGRGWLMGEVSAQSYHEDELISGYEFSDENLLRLEINIQSELVKGYLVYSGHLVSVNQPTQILFRENRGKILDFATGYIDAKEYIVRVNKPDRPEATENDWDKAAYLILPDTIPERVAQLAENIVRGSTDPYTMAQRIENYLRQYEYTLDVGFPPANRDVVDYFLFDLQRGYCDYYATAMVVLTRSVGLPSRIVVGYTQGEFDSDAKVYQVTGKEGHTWVEVYIEGMGWVEFEPTAGRPPIDRFGQIYSSDSTNGLTVDSQENILALVRKIFSASYFVIGIILVGLLVLISISIRVRYYSRKNTFLLLEAKKRIYKLAELCGVQSPEILTLLETRVAVSRALQDRFFSWIGIRIKNRVKRIFRVMVKLLVDVAYAGQLPETIGKSDLVIELIIIRRTTFILQLLNKFRFLRI